MEPTERSLLIPHFTERFRHDWWANATLLEFFEEHAAVLSRATSTTARPGEGRGGASRALHLFGHLLATELLWLGRVRETDDRTLPVWRARTYAEIDELYEAARTKWRG